MLTPFAMVGLPPFDDETHTSNPRRACRLARVLRSPRRGRLGLLRFLRLIDLRQKNQTSNHNQYTK